jgi:IS5 family transposase
VARSRRTHSRAAPARQEQAVYTARPEVECIGKGKARKPFGFGVKVSLAVTPKRGLVVGARSFPGNPYDGHTLAAQLEQTSTLLEDLGVKPAVAIVDLGFRGVDHKVAPVQVIHHGKSKTLTNIQRRWLKCRQAIEPAIGHAKMDHRMDRCWLKGQDGDALHAVLCAAGLNIRWLLRAIVRLGLGALLLASSLLTLWAVRAIRALQLHRDPDIAANRTSAIAQQRPMPSFINVRR